MTLTAKINVQGHDPGFTKAVAEALAHFGVSLVSATAEAAELVVLDWRQKPTPALQDTLRRHAAKCVVLTDHEDIFNINELLAKFDVNHVIGANGRSWQDELAITLQKLLSGDIWGVGPYFGDKVTPAVRNIQSASEINPAIEELLLSLNIADSFAATHEFLRLTANELVTNAVYNAPVDSDNKPKYEQTDRRIKVELLPEEGVEIAAVNGEHTVAILVTDRFGRLTRDKIVRHLVKCVNNTAFIEEKKGGAGAGLYLAFYTASQFIVNVLPGKKLQIICILEKNKRYKDYRSRVTSFHFFKSHDAKAIGGAA